MLVVYVAGPFRGPDHWAIENNIRRAEALSLEVWKAGAAAICPHSNTRFYQGVLPDQTWLDGDLAILRKCDALLLTEDWHRSEGARAEHAFALANGIQIFHTLDGLRRFLHLNQ